MKQWIVDFIVDTAYGPKKYRESFYMPNKADIRDEIYKRGGYVIKIEEHKRSSIERWLARSSWWQVQLLRGIQFRSTANSPGVALWRLIQEEKNPRMQNIYAPAQEALSRGLGIIDALRALKVFDYGTLAILAASERSNRLHEGIPHAIQNITQKRKNRGAIMGTMAWLGFDVITIVQAMFWGRGKILGWFRDNAPSDPSQLEQYNTVVGRLELLWGVLIWTAVGAGVFMVWVIFSYIKNKGEKDWFTAKMVRKIPLISGYLRDIGFADSTAAASRMLKGGVPIGDVLKQASEASNIPEVSNYWLDAQNDLARGVSLGAALDRPPLTRNERMELAGIADLGQVATIMEAISEIRNSASKTKHKFIVWLAFGLTGIYLLIAFGSSIFALQVMNMSMDSMMSSLTSM